MWLIHQFNVFQSKKMRKKTDNFQQHSWRCWSSNCFTIKCKCLHIYIYICHAFHVPRIPPGPGPPLFGHQWHPFRQQTQRGAAPGLSTSSRGTEGVSASATNLVGLFQETSRTTSGITRYSNNSKEHWNILKYNMYMFPINIMMPKMQIRLEGQFHVAFLADWISGTFQTVADIAELEAVCRARSEFSCKAAFTYAGSSRTPELFRQVPSGILEI